MAAKAPQLQSGDRIHYTALFLRSTGQMTGDAGFRKGTVLGFVDSTGTALELVDTAQFVRVLWDDTGEGMVNAFNVCRVGSRRSCAM